MFGIGIPELMVILVIALIVIGPKRLPEVAKIIGRGYIQFQRAFREVKETIDEEIDDIKKDVKIPDTEKKKKD